MKHLNYFFIAFVACMLLPFVASAQLNLPLPSPSASVIQTVGLTAVEVHYSSPAMRGRTVFGDLVPYNEVWRTGANKATLIRFSEPVMINDTEVPSGNYALFSIPGEEKWTIILNKETEQWGTSAYKASEDLLRLEVAPKKLSDMYERLRFDVEPIDDEIGHIVMRWADVEVRFPFKTNPVEQAVASINTAMNQASGLWYDYARAAEYFVTHGQSPDKAYEWVNRSLDLREHFYGYWVKAQVMGAKNNPLGAVEQAKMAKTLGEKDGGAFYKSRQANIEEAIENWTKQSAGLKNNIKKKK
ncbi:MAG: DUF2911 domain-containing protein [Bernardetiaceae bacterium]|nr:DUF2911 domain-containing protein [Bernardetiaceae bacterium]